MSSPRVYSDGSGVVLEIRREHNGVPRRIFLARAQAMSGGSVFRMGGPELAHEAIFLHVGGLRAGALRVLPLSSRARNARVVLTQFGRACLRPKIDARAAFRAA